MLRAIPIAIVIALFVILTLPVLLFFKLTQKTRADKNRAMASAMIRWMCRLILRMAGTDFQLTGVENIPEGAVLYMANHKSLFDVVCAFASLKTDVGFIAKQELTKVPILRDWMEIVHAFFLDRTDVRQGMKTILAAADLVNEGTSVWIFPEGTRISGDELGEFKGGSAKIAEKTGCPVVPVSLQNTEEIFDNHKPRIKRCTVTMHYCDPIYTAQLEKADKRRLSEMARQSIIDWRANEEATTSVETTTSAETTASAEEASNETGEATDPN